MTAIREALASARRSAVHLEMRDSYMLDDPAFLAWQRGERSDPNDRASWWRPWLDVVAEATQRGVVMRRARIISEPIHPYIRYEYDGTFTNIAAGEQVRWLPRRRTTDLLLPGVDFWAFDDELVIFNHFTGAGQWADPGMELCNDFHVAKGCAAAFEAIWDRAIPHDQYQPD
ncbi:DUF6879 family protein [Herbidospora mongoliensis]|uniref:DUF6879 family protein n=1 Tax=Herbidospora mongoliensis TaxID=688067 RepID=UPI001FDFA08E|nr:DUF6879 family protein [Herbidospora mongoliensis]